MSSNPPAGHPPVDWAKWEPAGPGDVRSPCPMINALANHHVLPHNGKGITKNMAIDALTHSINLSSAISTVFSVVALEANPHTHLLSTHENHFDLDQLDKHGLIEHDVSLSRNDVAFGDNHTFNKEIWDKVVQTYGGSTHTDFATASKARYERFLASKAAHAAANKDFNYGIKEFVLSYGETALFMSLLGDPKDGKIPLEYLRVLFEEERLPYKEGWRPNSKPVTQADMNHLIYNLITSNEHKLDEAKAVGMGTVHEVTTAVEGLLPTYCTIM